MHQRIYIVPLRQNHIAFYGYFSRNSNIKQILRDVPKSKQEKLVENVVGAGSRKIQSLSKEKPDTWKYKLYTYIQKILERIDYHEVFYKSVPVIPRSVDMANIEPVQSYLYSKREFTL